MKFASLALFFLSSTFQAEALNMRHRHHDDNDGGKRALEGDVTTTAADGVVHDPNPEEPDCSCYSDDDCVPIAWCRPMDDDPYGMKQCVPYLKEGDVCTGYVPIHMQTKCGESLVCSPSDEDIASNIVDGPGTCVKVCSSDDDCAHDDAWCRTIHDDPVGHCSPYRKEGEACSEFALVGLETKCDPSLVCTLPDGIMDVPGTCELPYEDSDDEIDGGVDEYGCTTGTVWCPELEECIQPWMTNCPFDGQEILGPVEMICTDGRCNDIPDDCGIAHNTWYNTELLRGRYIYNMNGSYWMPEGCGAVCQGCAEFHRVGYAPDEYNCNGASGMTWCPELEECVRPWETNCSFEDVSSPPPGGPGSSCDSDSDCTPNAWCKSMDYDPNGMKQCVLYLKEEDFCSGYGPIHLHTKCDPSLVCTPVDSTNLESGGICLATQPPASSNFNDASSAGSAATTRSYPPCVNHEVVVDCDHPDATYTDTPNPVEVVLLQGAAYNEVASTTITGFCQRNDSNQYVETIRFDNLCANADGVDLYISGHDAIFIDRVRLFRDDHLVRSWGSNNGLGWCLSEDPNDYNQGPKDWSNLLGAPFGVTCVGSMFFEHDGNIASADSF